MSTADGPHPQDGNGAAQIRLPAESLATVGSASTALVPTAPAISEAAVLAVLQRLAAAAAPDPKLTRPVAAVVSAYLHDLKDQVVTSTYVNRERILTRFVEDFGTRLVNDESLLPFELKTWITQNYPDSPWTRAGVHGGVQACMNWAARNRIIKDNPFRGLSFSWEEKLPRRAMTTEERRAVLGASDMFFKRFLIALSWTGARPGELAALKWEHLDWKRGIAVLQWHKNRRKTKKPRTIVWPGFGMAMLAWIKRHQHGATGTEMKRLLEQSPGRAMKQRDLVCLLRARVPKLTARMVYRARHAIGAKHTRAGGLAGKGYMVYSLPPDAKSAAHNEYVFLCSKGRPWTRTALTTKFARVKKKLGLDAGCVTYGLRHSWLTTGIRQGVNPMVLAQAAGTSVTMLERHYVHIGQDYDLLQAAVMQVLGKSAIKPADRPDLPDTQAEARNVVDVFVARIRELEEQVSHLKSNPGRKPRARKGCEPFGARQQAAWEAATWAIEQNPELAQDDLELFDWLAQQPKYQGQLPPSASTFRRYLNCARWHYGVIQKVPGRQRQTRPKPAASPRSTASTEGGQA